MDAQTAIRTQLGDLIIQVAVLNEAVDNLQAENAALRATAAETDASRSSGTV